MPTRLKTEARIVGTRRLVKALALDQVRLCYLALDADLFIQRQVREACRPRNIPIVEVSTMKELGEACGVQVKTASAGLKRA